jgi:hypothetical protein
MTNNPLANQRHGFAASLALPKAKPCENKFSSLKTVG